VGREAVVKILHVAYCAEEYGVGRFLLDILAEQQSRGPALRPGIAFHASGPRLARFLDLGVPVHSLGGGSARNPALFFRFRRVIRDYDVVNLHSHSPLALLAARAEGKRILFVFHGALGLARPGLAVPLRAYYRRILQPSCERMIFASKSSLDRYKQGTRLSPPSSRTTVFPFGIRLETMAPSEPRAEMRKKLGLDGVFAIGTAARMDPAKKIERLIEAFALLPAAEGYRLLIAGDGDRGYRDRMIALAAKLGLGERVRFLGYRPDALNIMAGLDLFVLPSQGEAFGLALLEAMALGVPAAVFEDGGGACDIIGASGIVAADPPALARAIVRLKSDGVWRERLARDGRARAGEFDIRRTADCLDSIYFGEGGRE
jgi:glycosyltransferase involved in cell wall biosynthesis